MLLEVKIQCDCGTRYKFDVEPLNGRLPTRVFCPGCGFDGTAVANEQLRQKLSPRASPGKTAPIPRPPPQPPATPITIEGAIVSMERVPEIGRSSTGRASTRPPGRVALGTAGAVMTGLVATLAWFFLIKVTGYQIGFAAWGVGLLIGMGARGFAREGSPRLGWVAGACALVAILAGQLLAVRARQGSLAGAFADGGVGPLTLLWLLLAVASAWKLGRSGSAA